MDTGQNQDSVFSLGSPPADFDLLVIRKIQVPILRYGLGLLLGMVVFSLMRVWLPL